MVIADSSGGMTLTSCLTGLLSDDFPKDSGHLEVPYSPEG
jgi:hypothetical protein